MAMPPDDMRMLPGALTIAARPTQTGLGVPPGLLTDWGQRFRAFVEQLYEVRRRLRFRTC